MITYLVILFIFFLIVEIFKSPLVKGIVGESVINKIIESSLDANVYRLFKNVTLPTESGSTQIDHLLVSVYGIFVIETKNMRGWIFGGPKQSTWTQKIYRFSSKFQNPLHQNYKHTQTVQSALGLAANQVFSVVVFVGDCEFKTPMPENVVYPKVMIRYIKNQTQPLISDNDLARICADIESLRFAPSLKTRREHVRHVTAIIEEKQNRLDQNQCPKCGKPMVLRTAKSGANRGGQFWGCSGFPKCRVMKSIS